MISRDEDAQVTSLRDLYATPASISLAASESGRAPPYQLSLRHKSKVCALNGSHGAKWQKHRIIDWRHPDGNGIDLPAKLRARTIIISGYAFGLPAGAAERHGTITKPITHSDLVTAVQRRIGNPGL
jgi:hypothetical protein